MRETHVLLEGVWERLVRAVEEGSKQQSKSLKGSKLRHTSTLTFSKTMHDATMSMNTQDEILVHRRLLLPLFPLPSVFSVFIPRVKHDSEKMIESQSTAIFTTVQIRIYLQDIYYQGDSWSPGNFCPCIVVFHFCHLTIPSMESPKEFYLKSTHLLFTLKVMEGSNDLKNYL